MILTGDVFDVLPTLEAESVHCVVTSPPYWGLRDYGTAAWSGGDAECDHKHPAGQRQDVGRVNVDGFHGSVKDSALAEKEYRATCGKCGAVRIDSQLGLEPTPEAYIERMVAVFREVRRVLRSDGTVWLNIGDSYASSGVAGTLGKPALGGGGAFFREHGINEKAAEYAYGRAPTPDGLKPKDLILIPARLALALQADGWWLRSDIIWAKPNPMPESVTDRPTSAHEHVFLLTKAARYFYDADAVREQNASPEQAAHNLRYARTYPIAVVDAGQNGSAGIHSRGDDSGRNLRNVWTIPTEPFPEAHFATYPKRLVEPCIKAGTSEKGCCGECGAPWEREVVRELQVDHVQQTARVDPSGLDFGTAAGQGPRGSYLTTTTGWRPTCAHDAEPVPCTVLDPFAGSGTTGVVAARLGREFVGIELSPDYAAMAERRIANWRREYAENPAPKVLVGQEGLW